MTIRTSTLIALSLFMSSAAFAGDIEQEALDKVREHQIKLLGDEKENCQTQLVGQDEEVKLLMTVENIKKLKYIASLKKVEFEFEKETCKSEKCFNFKLKGHVKTTDGKVKIDEKAIKVEKRDSIDKSEKIEIVAKERKDSEPLIKVYEPETGSQAEIVCKDSQKLALSAE